MDTTHLSLLIRVKSPNDQSAWREFDEIYRPMLFRFARACGLRDADADEIVQACMVSASQHVGSFEYDPSKGRFRGWLKTIVNNRVRSMLRDRRDQPAESAVFNRADAREESPEEIFDRVWRQEHLRHCLIRVREEVEPATFAAFEALVLQQRPVEDVCTQFGMSANQVYLIKSRLTSKIRKHMMAILGDDESEA